MAPPKENDRIVYILRRETHCGRCNRELWQKEFVCLTGGEAICLDCAGLAHLEYLPTGYSPATATGTWPVARCKRRSIGSCASGRQSASPDTPLSRSTFVVPDAALAIGEQLAK